MSIFSLVFWQNYDIRSTKEPSVLSDFHRMHELCPVERLPIFSVAIHDKEVYYSMCFMNICYEFPWIHRWNPHHNEPNQKLAAALLANDIEVRHLIALTEAWDDDPDYMNSEEFAQAWQNFEKVTVSALDWLEHCYDYNQLDVFYDIEPPLSEEERALFRKKIGA